MGAYAELRDPQWLAAHMTLRRLDCVAVASRCTNEQSRPVTRQMISLLKNGRLKRCKPDLAEAICRVLDVPSDSLFLLHAESNQMSQNMQRGAA